jgi:hypothetical protein
MLWMPHTQRASFTAAPHDSGFCLGEVTRERQPADEVAKIAAEAKASECRASHQSCQVGDTVACMSQQVCEGRFYKKPHKRHS